MAWSKRSPGTPSAHPLHLGLLLCLAGCAHRVRFETTPPGATVLVGDRVAGVTPVDVTVVWTPIGGKTLTFRRPGYRTVEVSSRKTGSVFRWLGDVLTFRWNRLTGKSARRTMGIILIADHEPVGAWTEDDVPAR